MKRLAFALLSAVVFARSTHAADLPTTTANVDPTVGLRIAFCCPFQPNTPPLAKIESAEPKCCWP